MIHCRETTSIPSREAGRGRGRGRGGRGGGDRPPRGRYHDRESQTGRVCVHFHQLPELRLSFCCCSLYFYPSSDTDKATNQGWGADTGTAELGAELQGAADAHVEEVTGNGVVADTTGWGAPVADASGWDAPAPADTSGWDAPAADASGWGAPAPAEATNGEANKDGKEGEDRRKRREDEEEDNTLTLDEYLAKKRAEELAALPKLDGQRVIKDSNEWKDAVQLLKEENEYFVGKVSSNLLTRPRAGSNGVGPQQTKSAPKAKPKKEEKVYIAIDLPPAQREGGRGGRGSRGGDRGGRGRGGDRGPRGGGGGGDRSARSGGSNWNKGTNGRAPSANVDVDDEAAFPSLS